MIEQKQEFNIAEQLLSRLDDGTLERFLGVSVVRAVRSVHNTNERSTLAKLVLLKFGESLLEETAIRLSLLDVLTSSQLLDAASQLGHKAKKEFECSEFLREYFRKAYNDEKSRALIKVLGLPDGFRKKTIKDSRRECEHLSVSFGAQLRSKGYLHDYQKNVKDQILDGLKVPGTRLMVQMPTGSGKTFTALETAVDILRRPFQKKFVVWLVNSNELAEQALRSFREIWTLKGDREIDVFRLFQKFSPDFRQYESGGVVFASYDLFYSILCDTNSQRNASLRHLIDNSEYVIVDEAHSVVADTYQACLNHFINTTTTQIVGLSATPFRQDPEEGQVLQRLFSNNLITIHDPNDQPIPDTIKYLQTNGFLANVHVDTLFSTFELNSSDENEILQALAEDSERNKIILDQMKLANAQSQKTLVFACNLDHVIALYVLATGAGIKTKFIIGATPQSVRPEILEEFNSGDLNILINLDILSTGIDLPRTDKLIITRPIKSPTLYSQIIGRGLRGPKNGGNSENTIVNILDNIEYFSSVSILYDSFRNQWEV